MPSLLIVCARRTRRLPCRTRSRARVGAAAGGMPTLEALQQMLAQLGLPPGVQPAHILAAVVAFGYIALFATWFLRGLVAAVLAGAVASNRDALVRAGGGVRGVFAAVQAATLQVADQSISLPILSTHTHTHTHTHTRTHAHTRTHTGDAGSKRHFSAAHWAASLCSRVFVHSRRGVVGCLCCRHPCNGLVSGTDCGGQGGREGRRG